MRDSASTFVTMLAVDERTPMSVATGPASTRNRPSKPALTSVQKYSPTSTFLPITATAAAPASPADAPKLNVGATV
ncbi:hypothetical protein X759_35550 [Mesorhizobium sp. LSHC420B00]|nr:hypothetical protein X759_35550 [Mesorhizobium sp. LSHC420B00]